VGYSPFGNDPYEIGVGFQVGRERAPILEVTYCPTHMTGSNMLSISLNKAMLTALDEARHVVPYRNVRFGGFAELDDYPGEIASNDSAGI
jgi:hypothetical protein